MKQVKKWWVAAVLRLLLAAVLAGVVWARASARPAAATGWKVLTIPAARCFGVNNPFGDSDNVRHSGPYVYCDVVGCALNCPVRFPHQGKVRVKRLTMYAYDNAGGFVRGQFGKVSPHNAGRALMGEVQTNTNAPDDPRPFVDTTIVGNPVRPAHGAYIYLYISGTSHKVYGFRIHYVPL